MKADHPDHKNQLARLARIGGQINGIRKMVEERRYCIDIVNQIKAAKAALTKVQLGIVEKHLNHCLKDAVTDQDPSQFDRKVEEMMAVLGQMA